MYGCSLKDKWIMRRKEYQELLDQNYQYVEKLKGFVVK